MWFINKKRHKERHENDQIAATIATRILRWQRKMADRLNNSVRHYERSGQIRWLFLFCITAAVAIVCSVLVTSRKNVLPHLHQTHFAGHIGQRSDGPPRIKTSIPTDSLTHKIQKDGNDQ